MVVQRKARAAGFGAGLEGERIWLHLLEKKRALQGAGGTFARLMKKALWLEAMPGRVARGESLPRAVCEHVAAGEKKRSPSGERVGCESKPRGYGVLGRR
ncbi:hypothetical protein DV096_18935 [Bradymonadaceae bacterium TMQ3]|nr:hypothetical protein DV096_18935 [Bradymonadaceae bacterium TMQ3]